MNRKCSRCGEEKPYDQFQSDASRSDGLSHWCRACKRAAKRDWQQHNPERVAKGKRSQRLKAKYGLSAEQHAALLRGGSCQLCGGSDSLHTRRVHERVHVVCGRCGSGLGTFGDDAALLAAAAALVGGAQQSRA